MEFKVEEVKRIEDGKHQGRIVAVEYRQQPYAYTDVVVELENSVKLRTGFPSQVTAESKLGKLLVRFGAVLQAGAVVDPEKILVEKKCSVLTMMVKTDKGTFANIVAGSLIPC